MANVGITPTQQTESVNAYSYEPLTSDTHIRLLHLRKTDKDGGIEAELVETDLAKAKELGHEALSYAWGKPLFTHCIYINGCRLAVTARLHSALVSLAQRKSAVFWIDAICINQNDLDEKAVQIALMYQIYHCAELVLIWLQGDDQILRHAVRVVPDLETELRQVDKNNEIGGTLDKNRKSREIWNSYNADAILNCCFEQEWFERLWVVQEVVAANSVLFICEFGTFSFNNLASIYGFMQLLILGSFSDRAEKGYKNFGNIAIIRSGKSNSDSNKATKHGGMLELLGRTIHHQCTDARDRLFALGGIVTDTNDLPYLANYRKNIAVVYTDFASHHIKRSSLLDILAYSGLERAKTIGVASWVPNWNDLRSPVFSRVERDDPYPKYSSSGRNPALKNHISLKGPEIYPTLALPGIVVDKIDTVWPTPFVPFTGRPYEEKDGRSMGYVGYFLEQLLSHLANHLTHIIPWSMLWRTLVCDISLESRYTRKDLCRVTTSDEQLAAAVVGLFISCWQNRKGANANGQEDVNAEDKYEETLENFQRAQRIRVHKMEASGPLRSVEVTASSMLLNEPNDFSRESSCDDAKLLELGVERVTLAGAQFGPRLLSLLSRNSGDKCICITQSGRLGWVPNATVPGDVVVIIALDVPLILRPCGTGTYKVVGESYIQGIMDGEAIEGMTFFDEILLI